MRPPGETHRASSLEGYTSTSMIISEFTNESPESYGPPSGKTADDPTPLHYYESCLPQPHQHHESTSTSISTTDSAGSSPTTNASMADDSSITELSPDSSPESPQPKPSLNNGTLSHPVRPHTSDDQKSSALFFEFNKPATPGKRPKNLKNLAVKTTSAPANGRAASTTALPVLGVSDTQNSQCESDSTFSRPTSPPKKRPTNLSLTIMTPANNKSFPANAQLLIPPTPSFARPATLRHFQSSPALPVGRDDDAFEAGFYSTLAQPTLERSLSEQKIKDKDEPNFDIPQSREEKPDAYPEGPICVFEPYVDLYLEPTAAQASEYDVILNVASEVRNPFLIIGNEPLDEPEIRIDGGGGIQFASRRLGDLDGLSLSTEVVGESSLSVTSSPTTPKATPPPQDSFAAPFKDPEYIHIPWEHNTDIVPDLLRLVKLIDDRVQKNKRVLVHCQCGVSRSATLVVAYAMFKKPQMTVQEAYDAVKLRSKWIGPNMNLIMQLQEFRSSLSGTAVPRRSFGLRSLTPIEASRSWNDWRQPSSHKDVPADSTTPKTAPLPNPPNSGQDSFSHVSPSAVDAGPSSAPSGIAWPMLENKAIKIEAVSYTHLTLPTKRIV